MASVIYGIGSWATILGDQFRVTETHGHFLGTLQYEQKLTA
jgi:hypothetical protein